MKKLELKSITKKFKSAGKFIAKYSVFLVVILVLCAYSFIVWRIRTLANDEPDSDVVSERLDSLKRPKIDQSTIDKIQKLQDTNVQVKALFNQARDNPFQD